MSQESKRKQKHQKGRDELCIEYLLETGGRETRIIRAEENLARDGKPQYKLRSRPLTKQGQYVSNTTTHMSPAFCQEKQSLNQGKERWQQHENNETMERIWSDVE